MKRRLFTILSALSLLLFVAVTVMWVRSHFASDLLIWYYDDAQPERWETRTTALESSGGKLVLTGGTLIKVGHIPERLYTTIRNSPGSNFPQGISWQRREMSPYAGSGDGTTLGFRWSRTSDEKAFEFEGGRMVFTSSDYNVTVPYWFIAVMTALPLLPWLPRMKRSYGRYAWHGFALNLLIAFAPLLAVVGIGTIVIVWLRSAVDEPVLVELITVVLAVPAAWWSVRKMVLLERTRRQRERSSMGRCKSCGYDLRATPERCPECGAVPQESHAS